MKVYHGSLEVVEHPMILRPNRKLDYGEGFYTTTSEKQSKEWAERRMLEKHSDCGYVNIYEFDEKGEQVGTEEFSDFNPRTDAIDQFYSEANQDEAEMDYSIDAPAQIEPEEYATDSVAVPVYDYDYAYYDEEVCSQ